MKGLRHRADGGRQAPDLGRDDAERVLHLRRIEPQQCRRGRGRGIAAEHAGGVPAAVVQPHADAAVADARAHFEPRDERGDAARARRHRAARRLRAWRPTSGRSHGVSIRCACRRSRGNARACRSRARQALRLHGLLQACVHARGYPTRSPFDERQSREARSMRRGTHRTSRRDTVGLRRGLRADIRGDGARLRSGRSNRRWAWCSRGRRFLSSARGRCGSINSPAHATVA